MPVRVKHRPLARCNVTFGRSHTYSGMGDPIAIRTYRQAGRYDLRTVPPLRFTYATVPISNIALPE